MPITRPFTTPMRAFKPSRSTVRPARAARRRVMSPRVNPPTERVVVPASSAATAARWNREAGRLWQDHPPRLVADLAAAWDLLLGALYEGGNWTLVRAVDVVLWAYEVGEAEPSGRSTLARSLAAVAGR